MLPCCLAQAFAVAEFVLLLMFSLWHGVCMAPLEEGDVVCVTARRQLVRGGQRRPALHLLLLTIVCLLACLLTLYNILAAGLWLTPSVMVDLVSGLDYRAWWT